MRGGGLQTNDGGYIISGITTSYGAGGSDVFLIKTNYVGQVQWTKTFGGQNNDFGDFIYQTNDGGFIISGTTESFGDGGSEYLIKTDSLGNAPTSISMLRQNENSVNIFPNPFSVSATVEMSNDMFNQNCHFTLYDVAGKEVMNFIPDTQKFTIQRNDLTAGIYFYSVTGNQNEILARGKIIIQ